MRVISPIGLALTIGFLAGHGANEMVGILPLFGAIILFYGLLLGIEAWSEGRIKPHSYGEQRGSHLLR
jgi:hypothetical protein